MNNNLEIQRLTMRLDGLRRIVRIATGHALIMDLQNKIAVIRERLHVLESEVKTQ